jgi:ribosomal protein L13E
VRPDRELVGYSVRLPAAMLAATRDIAADRGMTVGALLREYIAAGIAREKAAELSIPVDVLLAAVEEYRQQRNAS